MTAAAAPLHNRNIGFIGAGAMASAIIKGLLASGISPGRISASDPWEPARAKAKSLGLNVTGNAEVAIVSEIIVVAVKPDVVAHTEPYCVTNHQHADVVANDAADVGTDCIASTPCHSVCSPAASISVVL